MTEALNAGNVLKCTKKRVVSTTNLYPTLLDGDKSRAFPLESGVQ